MNTAVAETITVLTPLGIRFWDPALGQPIVDGLRVVAWPIAGSRRSVAATRTRSGVYLFRWLPGLRAVEHDYHDTDFLDASPPRRHAFVVAVEDDAERFLPVAFEVQLPLPYRGVFLSGIPGASLPSNHRAVHLLSAPNRSTGERLTAVRGTLLDVENDRPAAWALVSLETRNGEVFHGMADADGRVMVAMPYPSLEEGFPGSPMSPGTGASRGQRGWDLSVTVAYEPSRLSTLPGTPIPEYRSILDQRPGHLWSQREDASDLPHDTLSLRLSFNQPAVLRTTGRSVQLISAALGSP